MNIKKKNLISTYIKTVFEQKDQKGIKTVMEEFKKSPELKEAYYAINNLQYGICEDVDSYISHNVKVYRQNKRGLSAYKYKMSKIGDVDKSINYILENERGASNYEIYQKHYNAVKEHLRKNVFLKEQRTKVKELLKQIPHQPNAEVFKKLCEAKSKEDFFTSYRDKIIMHINSMLSEEKHKDQKLLLYEAKEKMREKLYTDTGFVQDVIYMKNLSDILNSQNG